MIMALSLLGYDTTSFARLGFGDFLPFFSTDLLKLFQAGWRPSVNSHFQFSPEMFDWFKVKVLDGALCVVRVILLVEGGLSTPSEVLSVLEQVFIKDISVLCFVKISLNPDQYPFP